MAYPKLWLRPVRDNFTLIPGKTVTQTAVDGGPSRGRKVQASPSYIITLNWTMEAKDYNYLWAFYRTAIDWGSQPFTMELPLDSADYLEYTCQFVADTFQVPQQQGLAFFVQATIEVFPNPVDVASDNLLLARNSYNA